jgi:hypothetical protein
MQLAKPRGQQKTILSTEEREEPTNVEKEGALNHNPELASLGSFW